MAKKEEKEFCFEESLQELEAIVKKLEVGDVSLDDAISEFNKAMVLSKICDEKLKTAEKMISKLVKDSGEIIDFQVDES